MRIILLVIVFYFPCCVFARQGNNPVPAPIPAPIPAPVPAPSVSDTQSRLGLNAAALQGAYNLQTLAMINGLTYDYSVFDTKGIYLSPDARYTSTAKGTL
jgi:hypothetical protein